MRDVLGHVQAALDGARIGPVGAGRHDRQRLVEHPRQHVTRPHAAARQAQDLVELPARRMHLERQALDQHVVLVPGHVQVFAVVGQHEKTPW
jgi:hypothetical protein